MYQLVTYMPGTKTFVLMFWYEAIMYSLMGFTTCLILGPIFGFILRKETTAVIKILFLINYKLNLVFIHKFN